MHICAPCALLRAQKKESDPLVLEWQMAVSCHMHSGNQTQVLRKSSQCSLLLIHLSCPSLKCVCVHPCGQVWRSDVNTNYILLISSPPSILETGSLTDLDSLFHEAGQPSHPQDPPPHPLGTGVRVYGTALSSSWLAQQAP